MNAFPQPTVVLSRCLELEPVRYNGQRIPYDFVRELEPWVKFIPVCPEVEIGLGVPRDPIRIVAVNGEARLLQPDTGRDLTLEMTRFSESFVDSSRDVDGFILKSRSPTCGIRDVKIYQATHASASATKGAGLFAGRALEAFPLAAIEDEGRLRNFRIREHFLTKLFAVARLRQVRRSRSMSRLVKFQAENKFLLMAYNQKEMRSLGRTVANHDKLPFEAVIQEYEKGFAAALARLPRYTSVINAFQHASGYFSDRLTAREKGFFAESLQRYRDGRMPAAGVSAILRSWIVRFDEAYLQPQTLFEPYPERLMSVSDSGKGRDIS